MSDTIPSIETILRGAPHDGATLLDTYVVADETGRGVARVVGYLVDTPLGDLDPGYVQRSLRLAVAVRGDSRSSVDVILRTDRVPVQA